ncbi:hypothetical protein FRC03_010617 [Tulasnella sp. 419]|nr:hypothetical protein FRC03_010617 [Tulasnella sp. 419]
MSTTAPLPPAGTSRTSLSIAATVIVGSSYVPPYMSSKGAQPTSRTTSSYRPPNPTTPAFLDDYQWINTYLVIHKMSTPSYRYAYLLWLVVVLFVVIFAALHLTGRRGGTLGARWSKWSLRRRTWRKKSTLAAIQKSKQPHRQPYSLPSNAQILSLIGIFVVPAILCCIGPDYIAPATRVWDLTHNLTRRAFIEEYSPTHWFHPRQVVASTPTTRSPEYTIPKAWWTAGGRTGIIAFSLFPLVVLFSLKAPPFALLALPFTIQIHFDKLARLHRWLGRMIWLVTTVHVVTWSIQLANDKRHGSRKGIAWDFVWVYPKFIYGIIGFVAMTLLTILSAGPIRTRYYEVFYISHVILVPITLVFSALHFPVIWGWCWAPLALWIAERLYRFFNFCLLNGIWGRRSPTANFQYPEDDEAEKAYATGAVYSGLASSSPIHKRNMFGSSNNDKSAKTESWEMDVRNPRSMDSHAPLRKERESQYMAADEIISLTSPILSAGDLTGGGSGGGNVRERVTSGDSLDSFTESIASYYDNSMADVMSASTPHRPRPHHARTGSASVSQNWTRTRWSSITKQPLLSDPTSNQHHPLRDSDGDDLGTITPTTLVADSEHSTSQQHHHGPGTHPPTAFRKAAGPTSSSYSVLPNTANRPTSTFQHQTSFNTVLENQSTALLAVGGGPRSTSLLQFHVAGHSPQNRQLPSRLPPLGYGRVQLLPGRTVRLTIVTPRRFAWAPGQHVLLNMPEISRWTSHPFTVASVSDQAIAGPEGREIVLIVRAKKGFTKQLWEEVKKRGILKREAQGNDSDGEKSTTRKGGVDGRTGVLMKAYVDGPFGSSVRARWGQHSSVLIICGGSGVSFGTSIMEFICLCMTGRDGRSLGGKHGGGFGKDGFVTRRVRFIWLIREYSHLHWCASIIRRCMDIVPNPNQLQVDVFVTNFATKSIPMSADINSMYMGGASMDGMGDRFGDGGKDGLQPPAPRFAREGKNGRRSSVSSTNSEESSQDSSAEMDYSDGGKGGTKGSKRVAQEPSTSHLDDGDEHVLDLTNFDGEEDARTPGEAQLSLKLKKEGRLRRAKSRKAATAKAAKKELVAKAAGAHTELGERIPQPTARIVPKNSGGERDAPGDRGSTPPPRWGTSTPKPSEDPLHPKDGSPVHHVRLTDKNRFSTAESFVGSNNAFDTRTLAGSESLQGLMMHHMTTASSSIGHGTALDDHASFNGEEIVFDIDDDEMEDLNVVSEMARPGKPRLDRILADEVERAKGPLAVACCGPTSLNALVRKLVAANIDPDKIAKGDLRGQITLISEDFEW